MAKNPVKIVQIRPLQHGGVSSLYVYTRPIITEALSRPYRRPFIHPKIPIIDSR